MHLVQLLVPIQDEQRRPFPRAHYDALTQQLADRFGGVTGYTRAPAIGLWEDESGARVRDQVIVYEVMVEELDREWWAALRRELEARFEQDELVIRALRLERL
jgi:hypothetical protein